MIRLSAFADEISADLNEQIAVLQAEHIQYIDLRSVWGVNVVFGPRTGYVLGDGRS
jgi:3-dehydroshikimate dehydratase